MPPSGPEEKRCSSCGEVKPRSEFHRQRGKPDGLQTKCRQCNIAQAMAAHAANPERARARIKKRADRLKNENRRGVLDYLLDHPCVDCGETDPVVLEFDHLRDKRMNVSNMCRSFSWSVILEEIAKCEVRCANCHTRKTARERGLYERKHMVLHTTRRPERDLLHNCGTRAVSSMDRASTF